MSKIKNVKPLKIKCHSLKENKENFVYLCPGCWNVKIGRAFLTAKLKNLGYQVKNDADKIDGIYLEGQPHLSDCPNEKLFKE